MTDPLNYYTGLRKTRAYLPPLDDLTRKQKKFLIDQAAKRQRAIDNLAITLKSIDHIVAGTIHQSIQATEARK